MKRPEKKSTYDLSFDQPEFADHIDDLEKHIDYLEAQVKSQESDSLPGVRISSKAETIRVIRNRAEYFENRGHHKYEETECRCAIDIIERLVPPDNFQDEA